MDKTLESEARYAEKAIRRSRSSGDRYNGRRRRRRSGDRYNRRERDEDDDEDGEHFNEHIPKGVRVPPFMDYPYSDDPNTFLVYRDGELQFQYLPTQ